MAEKIYYIKTLWVNDETKLNATNMNHIEQGIYENNQLANQNADHVDELFAGLTNKLSFSYDSQTGNLNLGFGDQTLPRLNSSKTVSLTNYFLRKENAMTVEPNDYVIPEEDK